MLNKYNTYHYRALKEKWIRRHRKGQQLLWQRHTNALSKATKSLQHAAAGTLGGLMLLTSPAAQPSLSALPPIFAHDKPFADIDKSVFLVSDLAKLLPKEVRPLSEEEEQTIAHILSRDFSMNIAAELQGKRLNRTYGFIGAEQHLARYPGDTMAVHFDTQEEARMYYSSGMAPGLGGWGYFVRSQSEMTEKDSIREKYYIAVQSFLSPGYQDRVREYIEFYRFRKMLVVNPNNGKAVVVVIGDAGPAQWTGKHLGGSPEVMHYLERFDGAQKGLVLYFFIDDPGDTIPLGPIEMQENV